MVRSITPDVTSRRPSWRRTPTPGAAGINVGTSATARFNEADERRHRSRRLDASSCRDAANAVVPATVTYDAATSTATLTPQDALAVRRDVHRHASRAAPAASTDLAGNALAADSTWSFSTEASPPPILVVGSTGNPFGSYLGEILRNEGLDAFTTIDVAFLSPALLAQFDVVLLGDTPLSAAQVTALTRLGQRRRESDRDAARQAARRAARADGRGHDPGKRLPPGRHGLRAGRRASSGSTMQFHGIGRPVHAERRHLRRNALLDRDDRDCRTPHVTLRSRRRERRPGGCVHVRPRALGRLHAPGEPGLGGPGARRRRRHPPRRPLLRRPRRRRPAGLGRHEQDR